MKARHLWFVFLFFPHNINGQWVQLNSPGDKFAVQEVIACDSMVMISASCGVFCSTTMWQEWKPVYYVPFKTSVLFRDNIFTGGISYPGYAGATIRKVTIDAEMISFNTVYDHSGNLNELSSDGTRIFAAVSSDGYSGNTCGFLWSPDGLNWNCETQGLPKDTVYQWIGYAIVYNLYSVASNDRYLFAGTGKGLYRSPVLDYQWALSGAGLPAEKVSAVFCRDSLVICAVRNNLYRSVDNGNSWLPVFGFSPGNQVNRLKSFHDTIFALTDLQGLYFSPDLGLTWMSRNTGLPEMKVSGLEWHDGEYFLGGEYGVVKGNDQWTSVNSNIICSDIRDMDQTSSGIAAVEFDKVIISGDEGETWQCTVSSDTIGMTWCINTVRGCHFFIDRPDYPSPCKAYLSCDAGATWSFQSTLPNIGDPFMVRSDGNMILACDDEWVFLSVDQGKNWRDISPPYGLTCNNYSDALWADGSIYLAACGHAQVIKSTDLGVTWTYCSTGLPDYEVYKLGAAPGLLIAASWPSLYLSFDKGLTWQEGGQGLPLNNFGLETEIRDFACDGTLLFACTDNRVFYSADSGFHWVNISEGLPLLSILWGGTLMVRDHIVYYGSNAFGIWKRSTMNLPSGSDEKVKADNWVIWPNPAGNWINISSDGKQQIKSAVISALTGADLLVYPNGGSRFNIGRLHPGIYFLKLETVKGQHIYKRFIKAN